MKINPTFKKTNRNINFECVSFESTNVEVNLKNFN